MTARPLSQVRRDPRMTLEGTDLRITGVGVHDGGPYRCEVEQDTDQPLAVVHTVEILGTFHVALLALFFPLESDCIAVGSHFALIGFHYWISFL